MGKGIRKYWKTKVEELDAWSDGMHATDSGYPKDHSC